MSTLADIFLSLPAEAAGYPAAPASYEKLEAKNLTHLELSTLWAILSGQEWDMPHMDAFPEVRVEVGEGTFIFGFPGEFTHRLATLAAGEIQPAAEAWAETEELDTDADETRPLIEEMARLATKATGTGQALFIHISE